MAQSTDDNKQPDPVTKPIDPEHPPLRVWLEVTRLANLPTVVTNVLTGLVIGFMASAFTFGLPGAIPPDHQLLWRMIASGGWLILIAAACFYAAGMTLNDVLDRHYDREHRPERPIPSGRMSTRTAVVAVVTFSLLGLLLILRFGLPATLFSLALLAAIVGYNALHRRFAITVVLMGVVRGLLYCIAAASVTPVVNEHFWRMVLPFGLIVTLYIAIVTFIARQENEPSLGRRALLAWTLPPLVLVGLLSVMPNAPETIVLAAVLGLVLLLWLVRCARQVNVDNPATRQAVMNWLAGLCLVDAYFLALMGRPAFAGVALICFGATWLWQRRTGVGT